MTFTTLLETYELKLIDYESLNLKKLNKEISIYVGDFYSSYYPTQLKFDFEKY